MVDLVKDDGKLTAVGLEGGLVQVLLERVVDRVLVVLRREGVQGVVEMLVGHPGVLLGHGQQHVRLADHAATGKVVSATQANLAAQALPAQLKIFQPQALTPGGDQHMRRRQVGVQPQGLLANRWMPFACHNDQLVQHQPRMADFGRHGQGDVHGRVHTALTQCVCNIVPLDLDAVDADAWRVSPDVRHQAGQGEGLQDVAHANGEHAV